MKNATYLNIIALALSGKLS